jgi:hypothetical protein
MVLFLSDMTSIACKPCAALRSLGCAPARWLENGFKTELLAFGMTIVDSAAVAERSLDGRTIARAQ